MLKNGLIIATGSLLFGFSLFAGATGNEEMKVCTREFNPVCAQKEIQCFTTPCEPIQQTYSNACVAEADGAEVISQGECTTQDTPMTSQELVTRAYNQGITSISNLSDFNFDGYVSREQAAKMIVTSIEKSGVEMWMIKQPEGTCEWLDENSIDKTLFAKVDQSCRLGLFKGDQGNFVPHATLNHDNLIIVINRAIQFIPALKDYFKTAESNNLSTNLVTRGQLITSLHSIMQYIKEGPKNEMAEHQANLNKARALWNASNISAYKLVQERSCFCPTEYTRAMKYSVVNNMITGSVVYNDDGSMVSGDKYEMLLTIPEAFDLIQESIDDNVESITVEYDPTYGYPTKLSIDRSAMIADEEMYYTFTMLEPVVTVPTVPATGASLSGAWYLSQYNNTVVNNTGVTLQLGTDNRMGVRICNIIGGDYSLSGNQIMFTNVMSTMMACLNDTITMLENSFNQTSSAQYSMSGSQLILKANNNTWTWNAQ